jgi:pSer/pThr/pTyr-binding forkhead associated (FHA) protein
MLKLILSLDGAFLGEFPVESRCVTIGRRPTNDIHIDNIAVSVDHARVVTVGEESFIEDMDSTNGSLLNGVPVKKHVLQHGDVIGIGKYQITYVNDASVGVVPGEKAEDFESTILVQPYGLKTEVPVFLPAEAAHAEPAAQAEDQPLPLARVQVLTGSGVGRELSLNKTLTTLGKPGIQVAVITRRPHGYFITHVEGAEHPAVNGVSIGVQAHQLNDHDVIDLAGVKMEFYLAEL